MKKVFTLILVTFAFTFQFLKAQNKIAEIYFNHLYIVLDSNTYNQLFVPAFITEKLGNVKTGSSTTTTDSWSGKYLFGKNGYFEFFSSKSYTGATVGDCGLGFITSTSKDLLSIETNWKKNSTDSIEKDTSTRIANDQQEPWFYSLYISRKYSLQPLSTWLMEHTPEHLQSSGFTAEEVKRAINWQEYTARKSKKEFGKSFNRITSIDLSLSTKEYEYFKKTLLGFGLQKKGNVYFNNQIEIIYTIDDRFPVRLRRVETQLTGTFPKRKIKISNNLVIHVDRKKAIWIFAF